MRLALTTGLHYGPPLIGPSEADGPAVGSSCHEDPEPVPPSGRLEIHHPAPALLRPRPPSLLRQHQRPQEEAPGLAAPAVPRPLCRHQPPRLPCLRTAVCSWHCSARQRPWRGPLGPWLLAAAVEAGPLARSDRWILRPLLNQGGHHNLDECCLRPKGGKKNRKALQMTSECSLAMRHKI